MADVGKRDSWPTTVAGQAVGCQSHDRQEVRGRQDREARADAWATALVTGFSACKQRLQSRSSLSTLNAAQLLY